MKSAPILPLVCIFLTTNIKQLNMWLLAWIIKSMVSQDNWWLYQMSSLKQLRHGKSEHDA